MFASFVNACASAVGFARRVYVLTVATDEAIWDALAAKQVHADSSPMTRRQDSLLDDNIIVNNVGPTTATQQRQALSQQELTSTRAATATKKEMSRVAKQDEAKAKLEKTCTTLRSRVKALEAEVRRLKLNSEMAEKAIIAKQRRETHAAAQREVKLVLALASAVNDRDRWARRAQANASAIATADERGREVAALRRVVDQQHAELVKVNTHALLVCDEYERLAQAVHALQLPQAHARNASV